MKRNALILFLLGTLLRVSAQAPDSKWIGDTLGPWTVINFEEISPYIIFHSSEDDSWEVGPPQKTIFNAAYSPPNAIVTSLSGYYSVNNHSWFDLIVGDFNTNYGYYFDLFIDFRHRIDSDTLLDGGYVTVSWNKGQSWQNILDDTISPHYYSATPSSHFGWYGNTNLYDATNLLCNGEHGFSGKSNGWIHSCMAWYSLPVKDPGSFPADTMILRFNFISDNIQNNREGWMIDDIRIFSIDLGGGIKDSPFGSPPLRITPNPFSETARVELGKTSDRVTYTLLDLSGRLVSHGEPGTCNGFDLLRGDLERGVYLLKVISGPGKEARVSRLVVW